MVRFRILLVATIASLSAIQGGASVVQGVKQEETVLRFKMKSLGGEATDLGAIPINRTGMVVARFGAGTKPDAPEVVAIIERELATKPTQP